MSDRTQSRVSGHFEEAAQEHEAVSLGMWAFLASEILFFGGLFLCYTVFRNLYPHDFAEASRHLDIRLGTTNTVILLTSSLGIALADHAAHAGKKGRLMFWLGIVIFLGLAFLGVKAWEYHHEWAQGRVPGLNWTSGDSPQVMLFFVLYFAMTALHAVHMIIGMGAMLVLGLLAWKDKVGACNPVPVEMMALYWHFVDIVWIFLFPLLYLIGVQS